MLGFAAHILAIGALVALGSCNSGQGSGRWFSGGSGDPDKETIGNDVKIFTNQHI